MENGTEFNSVIAQQQSGGTTLAFESYPLDALQADGVLKATLAVNQVTRDYPGLVSGGSGRGIRTTFAPQALSDEQKLHASFTFTTPATVGEDRSSAFRIGLYDKFSRAELEGDLYPRYVSVSREQ